MFLREYNNKAFLWFLAASTLFYFAAIRLFQDWLYPALGLGRPDNLFQSFGKYFARPEPLEMPLYFLGFLAVPVLALVLNWLYEGGWIKYLYWLVAVIVVVGGLKFLPGIVKSIPDPSLYFLYLEEEGFAKALWLLLTKRIFVTTLILALSSLVFVWILWRNDRFPWFDSVAKREFRVRWEPLLIVLILFLVFHPNLPTQDHHYNYYIGTVNDILQGKPILYETTHLYGLLNVYFLLFANIFLPFSYASLSFILFLFFGSFFISLYYLLKKWLGRNWLAVAGTLLVLTILFLFQTSPTRTSYFFPAMSPFRYGLYLPVLFLLYYYQMTNKKIFLNLSLLVAVIAVFWNLDTGLFLSAALLGTLAYEFSFQLKKILRLAGKYILYLALVFGLINLINVVIYGSVPEWGLFVQEVAPFGVGIGMTPLPLVGVFELFFFLYLTVALWVLRDYWRGQKRDLLLVFLVTFGIFSALYYVGESTWQNLYLISAPVVLIMFYLYRHFSDQRLIRSAFYALLVFSALLFAVKAPVDFLNRSYAEVITFLPLAEEDQELYQDAQYIKENLSSDQIALVHLRDTKLLHFAEKANEFNFYFLFNLYYTEDIEAMAEYVHEQRPKQLLIGHEKNDQAEYFVERVLKDYKKTDSLNTLDIYELIE